MLWKHVFPGLPHGALTHSGLSYQAVSDLNRTLERPGVIKIVRVGDQRPNGKASEFRYLLSQAENAAHQGDEIEGVEI